MKEIKPKGGLVSSIAEGRLKMGAGGYTVYTLTITTMMNLEVNPMEVIEEYVKVGFYVYPNMKEMSVTIFAPDGLSAPFLQLHPELGKRSG